MEISDFRCCLCPNINKPFEKTCPPGGPANKPETPCRFVITFLNNDNRQIFVAHGINANKKKWLSVRRGLRTIYCIKAKELPIRERFDEAQYDLNVYARNKGWKHEG